MVLWENTVWVGSGLLGDPGLGCEDVVLLAVCVE
jgi:hypothetical protein